MTVSKAKLPSKIPKTKKTIIGITAAQDKNQPTDTKSERFMDGGDILLVLSLATNAYYL
jgi:hypothetical protein